MRADRPRLRTQLLGWLLIPLLTLFAIDTVVSVKIATGLAEQGHDKALMEIAREVAVGIRRASGGEWTFEMQKEALRVLLEDGDDHIEFLVTDLDGSRLAGNSALQAALVPATHAGRLGLRDAMLDGRPVRVAHYVRPEAGAPSVWVAETRNKRDRLTREILIAVLAPQAMLIALAGLLVWIGVTRGLRPMDAVQRSLANRSHRDLSPIDESIVPGELRPIVQSFNALLARLGEVLALQSNFIADAAHQLKTPVAVLKTNVELLGRNPNDGQQRQTVEQISLGVERMSRLVSQLLALARNAPDAVRALPRVDVDLNTFLLEIASDWVPHAIRRNIDLGFEQAPMPSKIAGDPLRLRELFDNLIDNAIRYSESGGRVTVRVCHAGAPAVMICDDGPRIPDDERLRVFERFHRLLGSVEGSGLGLSIAREIAELHGATIELQSDETDGIGNMFTVRFPAVKA